MHIFVTNDDGVAAPGIRALARALSALAKITVIAPAEGVSSCSSALSLRKPMKLKKRQSYGENIEVYSLTGTTGDCCKLALEYWLKDDLPDLIVSGLMMALIQEATVFTAGQWQAHWKVYLREFLLWQFLWKA